VSNYLEKGRSEDLKGHHKVHNQQEAKPSLNPQIKEQLTTEGMGRMTSSSTLLISHS
jgi:hypothetical protein